MNFGGKKQATNGTNIHVWFQIKTKNTKGNKIISGLEGIKIILMVGIIAKVYKLVVQLKYCRLIWQGPDSHHDLLVDHSFYRILTQTPDQ